MARVATQAGGGWRSTNGRQASEAITDERYNRRVEEEAISKLERLGYPRSLTFWQAEIYDSGAGLALETMFCH